jgi:hypothetical protein
MKTGKHVGNCTKCNLILADFDKVAGINDEIAVCPRCSNAEKPGPMVHDDYVAKEQGKAYAKIA